MIRNWITGTYTFRFMISYVTGLSIAVFILLAITYLFYSYDFFTDVNNSLERELDLLQSTYQQEGAAGLEALSNVRKSVNKYDRFSYVLVDNKHHKLAGDLHRWPDKGDGYKEWADGWLSFEMFFADWTGEQRLYNFLARSRRLDNGEYLMVGRVADDVRRNITLVSGSLFWGMVIMILLGIIGGVITSVLTLRRVENINMTIRDIMSGDLSQRIKIEDTVDDFQRLSTNLNLMFDRIEHAVNDVKQVTNNIAHDLRTPLTRLRNQLSQLEKRSAPENNAMVRELLIESDSLLSTFSALLRISYIESGAKRENFTTVKLSQIVSDVVELYEPLASDKQIVLSSNIEASIERIGDKDLLFQMLANVVDNAIKYTPEQGLINVVLSQSEDQGILIQVSDSGVGIQQEHFGKVFQRFYRVEESRGVSPGNGLGLSLVKAVVALHYGTIELTQNAELSDGMFGNKGLQVNIHLPFSDSFGG